ncbi:MAG: thiamine phosphate synthase [Deltaproteobacteria bacterium]|jgi:thiamine-phosphate pyrophosphorylase|nr:thiamine phosphate synthase [Deltaproteobacteria bacterium]
MKHSKLTKKLLLTLVIGKDDAPGKDLIKLVTEAFQGGVTSLQLREKTMGDKEFYEEALIFSELSKDMGKLFMINNRVDIALAVDADGVHLGEDDLPLEAAAKILPKGKILGYSASSREKGAEAILKGADYLGVGALYPSPSKPEAPVLTDSQIDSILGLKWPTVGIGGITIENAAELKSKGFQGLAVISAIARAEDAKEAAQGLLKAFT